MQSAWREKVRLVEIPAFILDALVYFARCLMHKAFYEGHYSVMVICAECGFLMSVLIFIFAFIVMRSGWRMAVAGGSLVLTYLWFSDIAFWVMMK